MFFNDSLCVLEFLADLKLKLYIYIGCLERFITALVVGFRLRIRISVGGYSLEISRGVVFRFRKYIGFNRMNLLYMLSLKRDKFLFMYLYMNRKWEGREYGEDM